MSHYLPLDQQIKILFETVTDPQQKPFTLRTVSEATGISLPGLSQLRSGKIANPQLSTLRALCDFFNVPLRYFDTTSRDECLAVIAQGRPIEDTSITQIIASIAVSLSQQGQQDLLAIVQWALAAERQNPNAVPRLTRD